MARAAIGFFVAALIAAVLGFGGLAGAFTALAVLAFYVFAALFVVSFAIGLATGAGTHPGGAAATLVVAALVGAGVYWWLDHGMTAERLGRGVDRTAAAMRDDAGDAIKTASNETSRFVTHVGDDAKGAAERIKDKTAKSDDERRDEDR